jgi:hypothetical protein
MVLEEVSKIIPIIIDDLEIEIEIEDIHKDNIIEIMGKKMGEEIMEEEETIIIMTKTKGIEIQINIPVKISETAGTTIDKITITAIDKIKISEIMIINH